MKESLHISIPKEYQIALEYQAKVDAMLLADSKENGESEFEKFKTGLKSGEFYYPNFSTPEIDIPALNTYKGEIEDILKTGIKLSSGLQKFYTRLLVRIKQLQLIATSPNGITQNYVNNFQDNDIKIYPEANPELFLHLLTRLQKEVSVDLARFSNTSEEEKQNSELYQRAKKLNELLPTSGRKISYIPKSLHISGIEESIQQAMQGIDIEKEKKYSSKEIQGFFKTALENLGLDGWEVSIITDTNKTTLSVRASEKQVRIPEGRELKGKYIQTKIAHEICTHVVRGENGFRSKNPLLGVGFGKYVGIEEGLATLFEDHVSTTDIKKLPSDASILAVGLVRGFDGIPRDFKKLFEIYYAYHAWETLKSGIKRKSETLLKNSWKKCVRTFQGINTHTKGACSGKDFSYQQGYIDIIDFLSDLSNEEQEQVFQYLMKGKFNMFDPDTREILDSIPESVQKLFSD